MKPCVSFLNYVFNFTHEQNDFSSTIYHFIVISDFASNKSCFSYVLCDDSALGEVNFSDHYALSLSINLNAAGLTAGPTCPVYAESGASSCPACHRATSEHIAAYHNQLSNCIAHLLNNVPYDIMHCEGCNQAKHKQWIEQFEHSLNDAISLSVPDCIPLVRPGKIGHGFAGWNDECREQRDHSLFWHRLWIDCGRPRDGVVAITMGATRRRFYLIVRNILRNQQNIKNNKLADAFVTGHSEDFWFEVKRVNCMRTVTSPAIEDYSNPRDIANAFSNNFSKTFRADFADINEISDLRKDSDKHCNETRWNNFAVEEVIFACSILKPNKKDADLSLNSLSIINASHNFCVTLCLLINIVIVHGYTALAWQAGTIIPLHKSGSLNKSLLTSYRPITLSILFGKIID